MELKKHYENLKECEKDLERLLPSCREEYRKVRKEYERHRNDLNIDFKYSEFRSGFFLQGARFARPVTLKRASISDTLNLNGARFGDTVSLYGTKMGRLRFKDPWFRSESIDLRECTFEALGGFHLACHPPRVDQLERLAETFDSPPWRRVLDPVGLGRLAGWIKPVPRDGGADEVLNKIVDKTKFSMQPYLQLEKWYLLGGDENKAREIYRSGRRRARKNARWVLRPKRNAHLEMNTPESHHDQWPWWRMVSDWILDKLIGYGTRIQLLLLIPILLVLFGALYFVPHSKMETVEGYSFPQNPSAVRGIFERLYYSADLFVPLVRFGVDERWRPDAYPPTPGGAD